MHLQFSAQDDHCKNQKSPKSFFEMKMNFKNFITNILYFINRSVALVIAHIRAIELEKIVESKWGPQRNFKNC